MQLLGSIIYITSSFYRFGSLLSTLDSLLFLYLHNTIENLHFQDGMFHKKQHQKLEKLRIDKYIRNMV